MVSPFFSLLPPQAEQKRSLVSFGAIQKGFVFPLRSGRLPSPHRGSMLWQARSPPGAIHKHWQLPGRCAGTAMTHCVAGAGSHADVPGTSRAKRVRGPALRLLSAVPPSRGLGVGRRGGVGFKHTDPRRWNSMAKERTSDYP